MKKIIAIITAALILSGSSCAHTSLNLAPGNIFFGNIDSSLLEDCDLPVKIPQRRLSQVEVEKYWSIDRKNLIICAKRHGFLGDAVKFRDELIQGKPKAQKER